MRTANARPAISPDELRPAFDNTYQAVGFLLLLVITLTSPILLSHVHYEDRQHVYRMMREFDGDFTGARDEIFDVKEDIDILFAANSTLWAAVSSRMVEESLTRRLGRRARVVTFGSNYVSIDVLYMEVRDALAHKHVHMVVVSIPRFETYDGPSPVSFRFLGFGDPPDATEGLPFGYRPLLYAGYVLRSPRDAMECLRPSPATPSLYARNNGSLMSDQGWYDSPFSRFTPRSPDVPADAMIYSESKEDSFEYTGEPLPPYQSYYLKKLCDLLEERHVGLVMVNVPTYEERQRARPIERQNWPSVIGQHTAMVGVPPVILFHGLSGEDVRRLYYNGPHMNRNGSELYTRTITPALLQLYAHAD